MAIAACSASSSTTAPTTTVASSVPAPTRGPVTSGLEEISLGVTAPPATTTTAPATTTTAPAQATTASAVLMPPGARFGLTKGYTATLNEASAVAVADSKMVVIGRPGRRQSFRRRDVACRHH